MVLGPYAGYVLSAYGISLAALIAMVIVTVKAWQKAKRAVAGKPVQLSETNL